MPLATAQEISERRGEMLLAVLSALALKPPAPVVQLTRTAVLRSAAAAAAEAVAAAALAVPPPEMLLKEAAAQVAAADAPQVLFTPPSVKGASTPEQLALAQHLKKRGAKFYGAYWCPFCTRQRTMFGAGGVRALPYVECAPDGFGAQRCPSEVSGYPAWEIDGKFYSGMKTLPQLQSLSGFDAAVVFPAPPPPPPAPAAPPGGFKLPAVAEPSTPELVRLATHLKQSGAVFYGAYWCKYCRLQVATTAAPPHASTRKPAAPHASTRTPANLQTRTSEPPQLRTSAPPRLCSGASSEPRGRQRCPTRSVRPTAPARRSARRRSTAFPRGRWHVQSVCIACAEHVQSVCIAYA